MAVKMSEEKVSCETEDSLSVDGDSIIGDFLLGRVGIRKALLFGK